jgi:cytochrome c biogenesis protein CcdA
MGALLSTGGLIAAFFAGSIALFAPCCVVFLLPGYLAGAVKNRRWRLIPLTIVFASGLALVVVPIAAGVTMISSFIAANHTVLFMLGSLLMVVFAVLSVSGRMWSMPSFMTAPNLHGGGYAGFFAFGVFSGIASSCCAPVLAGVLTLSAISQSPVQAIILGLAYVLGMVFPLLLIALAWDAFDLGRRSFTPKPLTLRLLGRTAHTNIINLCVGAGFLVMAVLIGVVAFSGEMPTGHQQPLGFLGTWIADVTAPIARATAGMPIIIQGILLIALAALVMTAAIIIPQRKHDTGDEDAAIASILEHEHDHDTHGAGADEQQES